MVPMLEQPEETTNRRDKSTTVQIGQPSNFLTSQNLTIIGAGAIFIVGGILLYLLWKYMNRDDNMSGRKSETSTEKKLGGLNRLEEVSSIDGNAAVNPTLTNQIETINSGTGTSMKAENNAVTLFKEDKSISSVATAATTLPDQMNMNSSFFATDIIDQPVRKATKMPKNLFIRSDEALTSRLPPPNSTSPSPSPSSRFIRARSPSKTHRSGRLTQKVKKAIKRSPKVIKLSAATAIPKQEQIDNIDDNY